MATAHVERLGNAYGPYLRPLLVFNILFAAQLATAIVYGIVVDVPVQNLRLFLLPFIWTTVSIMAVWYTLRQGLPDSTRRTRLVAGGVAGGYLLLVFVLSGVIGTPIRAIEPLTNSLGFAVEWDNQLGWGPVLLYTGDVLGARVIPYQFVGYLAVAFLIYAAILDVTSSAAPGVIGVALCPGCAAALVAPALAGAATTSAAFVTVLQFTYELATVLFVGAVALLYWQPTFDRLRTALSVRLPELAAALAALVAALHLFHPQHGMARLILFVEVGTLFDPRPLLFTLSGLAIIAGITLAYAGASRKPLLLAGMVLVLTYILGYGAWHTVLDHGAFWPHIDAHGHGGNPVVIVATHLAADSYALASKLTETLLLGILAVLYLREN